jgi:Tfp pilus assembly protein PilP
MRGKFSILIKIISLCLAIGFSHVGSVNAQSDGLDQNSFETPTNEEDSGQDQDFEINDVDNQTPDGSPQNAQPNTEQDFKINDSGAENTDLDLNAPVFDQGALPEEGSPENLSDQIRDMNPDSLTGQQDYFPSFIYDDRGRKDPFAPRLKGSSKFTQPTLDDSPEPTAAERIRAGLAKFEVASLTLTAILIGKQNRPKALIKDPAGTVYVIHENDIIGRNNGVVKKIRQGQVVILEYRDQPEGDRLYTTQVLSLGK